MEDTDIFVHCADRTAHLGTHVGTDWLVNDERTTWGKDHAFFYIFKGSLDEFIGDAKAAGLTVAIE